MFEIKFFSVFTYFVSRNVFPTVRWTFFFLILNVLVVELFCILYSKYIFVSAALHVRRHRVVQSPRSLYSLTHLSSRRTFVAFANRITNPPGDAESG